MLTIIYWHSNNFDLSNTQITENSPESTYQSEHTTTVVYDALGELRYKLAASHISHFEKGKLTWFIQPAATIFNAKIPTWVIKADRAKLIQDKVLYLYGHIQIDNLILTSQFKRIITDNAMINLETQDFCSDDKVILYGINFYSTAMKMRGNLREKTIELFEKVQTYYEIQTPQYVS